MADRRAPPSLLNPVTPYRRRQCPPCGDRSVRRALSLPPPPNIGSAPHALPNKEGANPTNSAMHQWPTLRLHQTHAPSAGSLYQRAEHRLGDERQPLTCKTTPQQSTLCLRGRHPVPVTFVSTLRLAPHSSGPRCASATSTMSRQFVTGPCSQCPTSVGQSSASVMGAGILRVEPRIGS